MKTTKTTCEKCKDRKERDKFWSAIGAALTTIGGIGLAGVVLIGGVTAIYDKGLNDGREEGMRINQEEHANADSHSIAAMEADVQNGFVTPEAGEIEHGREQQLDADIRHLKAVHHYHDADLIANETSTPDCHGCSLEDPTFSRLVETASTWY